MMLVANAKDSNSRERTFTFSSEIVVDRWFGGEVLDHASGSVRMDFIKSGNAPFLLYHDTQQPIGVIESASIKDKTGRGTVRFGRTQLATDALDNVDDRILNNTSVGYRVHEMTLDSSKQGNDVYRIVDWEPFEVSLVAVPADPTVGMDRSLPTDAGPPGNPTNLETEARITQASSHLAVAATSLETSMTDTSTAAAGSSAGTTTAAAAATAAADATRTIVQTVPGPSAAEIESSRVRAIENLCKSNNFEEAQKRRWIGSGMAFDKVSDEMLQIMEARGKANEHKNVAHLDLSAGDTNRFSTVRAIRAISEKSWEKAPFEAECSREISQRLNKQPDPMKFYVPYDVQKRAISHSALSAQQRALNLSGAAPWQTRADVVGTLGSGGYLVETQNVGFVELLRNRSVIFRLGARQLSGLVGNINVPKQTGAASAFWTTSETNQITENEQTFGQMSLTPKTVGAYTEVSRLLLLQSSPDVEGIVNADLAAVTALAVDTGGLNGPGTGGQPLGVFNTTGVGTASGMSTIAYAGQLNFQVAVANANVMPVSGAYATTPTVAALLMQRTRFANTATPLWDGNLWDANGALQCAGFPGMSSKQIPTGSMVFGDWNSLVVAEWGVLEIEVNPYANFQAGIIGIRALMTCDIGLRYPGAFCTGASIT